MTDNALLAIGIGQLIVGLSLLIIACDLTFGPIEVDWDAVVQSLDMMAAVALPFLFCWSVRNLYHFVRDPYQNMIEIERLMKEGRK